MVQVDESSVMPAETEPDTSHMKSYADRVTPHVTPDVKWIADLDKPGLPNDQYNRVYPKAINFCYTQDFSFRKKSFIPLKEPSNDIQIRFKGAFGMRVILETEDCETILSIKQRVQDQLLDVDENRDYPAAEQMMYFHNQLLEDDKTVGHYGIKRWQTINLTMRPPAALFTTIAQYEKRGHKDKAPKLCEPYGFDHDSRYLIDSKFAH